jgi:hypothetical protein
MGPPATPRRDRIYVTVAVAHMFWDAGVPMLWGDVHLPHGWHLSLDRVPVPPIPAIGRARLMEIQRQRAQLPADLREDPSYDPKSPYWDLWFEVEHDPCRCTFFASRTATAKPYAEPRTPATSARRASRHPGGLYIDEPEPQTQPRHIEY